MWRMRWGGEWCGGSEKVGNGFVVLWNRSRESKSESERRNWGRESTGGETRQSGVAFGARATAPEREKREEGGEVSPGQCQSLGVVG